MCARMGRVATSTRLGVKWRSSEAALDISLEPEEPEEPEGIEGIEGLEALEEVSNLVGIT